MLEWRKILGFVTLAIASAGPLPLWWHHAQCHSLAGHSHACHSHAGHAHLDCNQNATLSHTHAACGNQHSQQLVDSSPQTWSENSPATTTMEVGSYEHECWVCFQLSQTAAVPLDLAPATNQLVTNDSAIAGRQFLPATVCGLYSPRGPPACTPGFLA